MSAPGFGGIIGPLTCPCLGRGAPLYLSGFPQTFSLRLRRDVRRGNEMREDTEGPPQGWVLEGA